MFKLEDGETTNAVTIQQNLIIAAPILEMLTTELPTSPTTERKLYEYQQLVVQLRQLDPTESQAVKGYLDNITLFTRRIAEASAAAAVPNPVVSIVNNHQPTPPAPYKPKGKENAHDGEIASFRAFWIRFQNEAINNNALSDDDKMRLLLGSIHQYDVQICAGMKMDEAEKYLKSKYTSPTAVRDLMKEKMSGLSMRSEYDRTGLKNLLDEAERMLLLAKDCGDTDVEAELFSLVYNRIPAAMQYMLMKSCKDKKSGDSLVIVLKEELQILVARSLIYHPARKPDAKAQPVQPGQCYRCKQSGHLAKDCNVNITSNKTNSQKYYSRLQSDQPKRTENNNWRAKKVATVSRPRVEKPRQLVTVNDQTITGIIDTGADITAFPESVVEPQGPLNEFVMADGQSTLKTHGPAECTFTLAGESFHHPIYTYGGDEAVIGNDLLKPHGAVIDLNNNSIVFAKPPEPRDGTTPAPALEIKTKSTPAEEDETFRKMVMDEFADLMVGLGKTDLIEHSIDTGDSKPITIRGRRIPAHYVEDVAQHVKELLNDDIIEESQSEWQFPLVIVKKKDGSIRMANDLRELNKVTVKDNCPMPRVDEFTERAGKARIFSRIDLRKGYYQIMLREGDRVKTAFTFKGKLYQFKRMVFGACNAPQTFQRLMAKVLGDLPYAFTYLDDVLIYSDDPEEHLKHLREVLSRIRQAGLRLNSEKCEFGKDEIEFLGFHVKDGKRSPTDEKCNILANYKVPTSPKEVKSFVGLANFYHNLVPNFSQLTAPLHEQANKKEKEFVWTKECHDNFRLLQEEFRNRPTTHLFDLNLPFIVTCDASDKATGAVLWQIVDGKRHIVEFTARMFSKAERNYSTIEREATAILWAIEKWEYYLLGKEFTIETDHKPLHWLLTKKNTTAKLQRLAGKLQEFKIKGIEHVKGEENILADALSRIEICLINTTPATPSEALQRRMARDPARYRTIGGRIYLVEGESKRLYIDTVDEKRQILSQIHDNEGHLGFYKSSEAIRQRFFWPKWKKDLKRHLKECFTCQTRKDDIEPFKEEMVPLDSETPFQRVHVDICGPLIESNGNKHFVVLQDACSKWIEAKPIPNTRSATIIDWLVRDIFFRHGVPDMITTDNGTQFDSREFREFCADRNIELHLASPYHHQGNGLVERAIRTLQSMLRTSCADQNEWSTRLPDLAWIYNTRKHLATGVSPFSLVYGREPRIRIDHIFQLEPIKIDPETNRTMAKEKRTKAMKRVKRYYDRKWKPSNLSAGQLALWHVIDQGVGTSKKLNRKWRGPFRVEEIVRPKARLTDRDGDSKWIHLNHLKSTTTSTPLVKFPRRGRPRTGGEE